MNVLQRVYVAEMRLLYQMKFQQSGIPEQLQKCEEAYRKLSKRELRELERREAFRPFWYP